MASGEVPAAGWTNIKPAARDNLFSSIYFRTERTNSAFWDLIVRYSIKRFERKGRLARSPKWRYAEVQIGTSNLLLISSKLEVSHRGSL